MLKRTYTIVAAAAGTRLSQCVDQMRLLIGYPDQSAVNIVKVSSNLRRPVQHGVAQFEFGNPIDIRELMTLSRPMIDASWDDAVGSAINSLAPASPCSAIACHLTAFDRETKVFCAPGSIEASRRKTKRTKDKIEWRPSRVVILIDDIYDMYADLSDDGNVLGRSSRLDGALKKLDAEDVTNARSLAGLDADVSGLKTVLAWRRAEMIQAEYLATQLQVPLVCLGTKHPATVAPLILREASPPVVYISHPITRYREEIAAEPGSDWNDDAYALNDFADFLSEEGVVGVMPTAIDELRFKARDLVGEQVQPLAPRWPRINSERGLLGYPADVHARTAAGFKDIPVVDIGEESRKVASTYLRTLESLIFDEIPFRDHFLVNNCDHLLVFRPRAEGKRFSGGVSQEIAFWTALRKMHPDRKMAVIHQTNDVQLILSEFKNTLESSARIVEDQGSSAEDREEGQNLLRSALSSVIQSAKDYLRMGAEGDRGESLGVSTFTHRMKLKYNDEMATEILYKGDIASYEGPLFEATLKMEARGLQRDAWKAAITPKIERALTYLNVPSESCRIFISDSIDRRLASEVAAWFLGYEVSTSRTDEIASMINSAVDEAAIVVAKCEGVNLLN